MHNTDADWWDEINSRQFNWPVALIYADWLDDQGRDLEAVQLRFATQASSWYFFKKAPRPEGTIQTVLELLKEQSLLYGDKHDLARSWERDWCKSVGVPFIRFFPRSVEQIEAALQPSPPKPKRYAAVFSGGPKDGEMMEVNGIVPAIRFPYFTQEPVRPMTPEELSRPVKFDYHEYHCDSETIGHPDFITHLYIYKDSSNGQT